MKVVGPLGGKFDFSVLRDLKFKVISIKNLENQVLLRQSFEMLSEQEILRTLNLTRLIKCATCTGQVERLYHVL